MSGRPAHRARSKRRSRGSSLSPQYLTAVTDFSRSPDVQNITRTYGFLRIVALAISGLGARGADALSEQPSTIATRHVGVSAPDGRDANRPGLVGRSRIDRPRDRGDGRRARRRARHGQRDRPSHRPARTVPPGTGHHGAVVAPDRNGSRRDSRRGPRRRGSCARRCDDRTSGRSSVSAETTRRVRSGHQALRDFRRNRRSAGCGQRTHRSREAHRSRRGLGQRQVDTASTARRSRRPFVRHRRRRRPGPRHADGSAAESISSPRGEVRLAACR